MLFLPPPQFHRQRPRARKSPPPAPPPAALTLLEAFYEMSAFIRLRFDRAINIAGLVGNQITVDDGWFTGQLWTATGEARLFAADTVDIDLNLIGSTPTAQTLLNAGADNGIVALDDGGAWPGVTEYPLPMQM